ncbi:hypothetical protein L1987_88499 [Smallanthus sonchifolius]|nr:hypothetical protein L1987_88499 [Smallanthus sonchifolius]
MVLLLTLLSPYLLDPECAKGTLFLALTIRERSSRKSIRKVQRNYEKMGNYTYKDANLWWPHFALPTPGKRKPGGRTQKVCVVDIVQLKKKVMKLKIGLPTLVPAVLDKARIPRRSQLNEEQDLSEPERLHPMSLSSLKPKGSKGLDKAKLATQSTLDAPKRLKRLFACDWLIALMVGQSSIGALMRLPLTCDIREEDSSRYSVLLENLVITERRLWNILQRENHCLSTALSGRNICTSNREGREGRRSQSCGGTFLQLSKLSSKKFPHFNEEECKIIRKINLEKFMLQTLCIYDSIGLSGYLSGAITDSSASGMNHGIRKVFGCLDRPIEILFSSEGGKLDKARQFNSFTSIRSSLRSC